jgi:hypothetical protein
MIKHSTDFKELSPCNISILKLMFHCKKNDRRKETLKKTKGAIKK